MASLRRVKSSSALPNSDQAPQLALSRELPSTADLKFVRILISTPYIIIPYIIIPYSPVQVEDRSEATNAAIENMEVKHGEPLVVQFAAP